MSVLNQKAAEAAIIANDGKKENLDPITIMLIFSVLMDALKLYIACKSTAPVIIARSKKPAIFDRWKLRNMVRSSRAKIREKNPTAIVSSDDVVIVNSILKMAANLTTDEAASALAEAVVSTTEGGNP